MTNDYIVDSVIYHNEQIVEFCIPTQVKFYDSDGDHWQGGIGYGKEIICGCCGGVIPLDEIYDFAPHDINPIKVLEWINLEAEIRDSDMEGNK